MKRYSLLAVVAFAFAFGGAGCSHIPFIGKKKAEPKQSRHIATDSEKEFEDRWVEHRAAELISQGQTSDQAQEQAQKEFMAKFPALTIAGGPQGPEAQLH